MYKIIASVSVLLSVCCLYSCTKDLQEADDTTLQVGGESGYYQIHVSVPDESITKVAYEGDEASKGLVTKWRGSTSSFQETFLLAPSFDWADSDMSSAVVAKRVKSETDDSKSATFEYMCPSDYQTLFALYPYKNYETYTVANHINNREYVLLDASRQPGTIESLSDYDYMVGRKDVEVGAGSIQNLSFEHKVAVLRLSHIHIDDHRNCTVEGITVRSNAFIDKCYISAGHVSHGGGPWEYYNSISCAYGKDNRTITATNPFKTDGNGDIEENIYLAFFPSSENAEDITISVKTDKGTYGFRYEGDVRSFEAGHVYTLDDVRLTRCISATYDWYKKPVGTSSYEISSESDFLGFAKLVNGDPTALECVGETSALSFTGKTVKIKSGIQTLDMSKISIVDKWVSINGFSGTFDGNNCRIINHMYYGSISGGVGLFDKLTNAVIKNLSLSGMIIGTSDKTINCGTIATSATNTTFVNCKSSVEMNIIADDIHLGGVCGLSEGCTFIACEFSGDIYGKNTWTYGFDSIGGIVSYSSGKQHYIGCMNRGSLALNGNENIWAGGILGGSHDGYSIYCIGCFSDHVPTGRSVYGYSPGFILGYTRNLKEVSIR